MRWRYHFRKIVENELAYGHYVQHLRLIGHKRLEQTSDVYRRLRVSGLERPEKCLCKKMINHWNQEAHSRIYQHVISPMIVQNLVSSLAIFAQSTEVGMRLFEGDVHNWSRRYSAG